MKHIQMNFLSVFLLFGADTEYENNGKGENIDPWLFTTAQAFGQ